MSTVEPTQLELLPTAPPELPFWTLVRIAFRSLFIQAGFSPEAMQTLGLLYALAPAWPHLYADEAARNAAVRRHLTPFNTHPYAAAALVGGILFYELRLARHQGPAEDIARFKTTLMGPLAALGDGFFWLSLRPATGAIGVALIPLMGVWAPLAFIIAYNAVHFAARGWLFVAGYRHGSGVVARLKELKVPTWSNRLRSVAAAAAAGMGVWVALRFGALSGSDSALYVSGASFGLGVIGVLLVERNVSPLAVLYGTAALAGLAGIFW
ncbi:MAG: PTS system mannose/fructose/sorbose family transporter subunit IID [Archangium sp.]